MENPRGILRPAAVGRLFTLDRPAPPPDLAGVIDHHWIVGWDLRGHAPYRSEVMTHPAVHIVFEPDGALVYGVRRKCDVRILSETGWAVGTKLLPGGLAGLMARPVAELTDTAQPLGGVFGPDGETLARDASEQEEATAKLALLHAFLRTRMPAAPGPDVPLVQAVVRTMRHAPPGTRVDAIAARHHTTPRTLQRLFHRHVGVTPKWVLQRYRLHEALERLDLRDDTDWTRLALELGYYDHAHYLRDFRAVTGRSPAEYEAQARAARSGA